jgi:hypothetical protein
MIQAGKFSAPQLFDVEGDGLPDLVIGNQKGTLIYYHNTGTLTSPVFTHVTDSLGKVSVTNPLISYDGYSVPFFFNDPSGKTGLIVGCEEGKVHYYTDIDGNLDGCFSNADSLLPLLCGSSVQPSYGYRTAATIAPLSDPDLMDLIVGNFSGGLNYCSHQTSPVVYTSAGESWLTPTPRFIVYPNPADEFVYIQSLDQNLPKYVLATLYNNLGQPAIQKVFRFSQRVSIQVGGLPEGIYLLSLYPLAPNGAGNIFTSNRSDSLMII